MISSIRGLLPNVSLRVIQSDKSDVKLLLDGHRDHPTPSRGTLSLRTVTRIKRILTRVYLRISQLIPLRLPVLVRNRANTNGSALTRTVRHTKLTSSQPFIQLSYSLLATRKLQQSLTGKVISQLSSSRKALYLRDPTTYPLSTRGLLLNLIRRIARTKV